MLRWSIPSCSRNPFRMQQLEKRFLVLCNCCAHVHLTRDAQPRIFPISYPRRATQTLKRTEIVGQCRNRFGPDDEGNPAGTPGPRCFDHFGMEFVEFSPPALGCPRRVCSVVSCVSVVSAGQRFPGSRSSSSQLQLRLHPLLPLEPMGKPWRERFAIAPRDEPCSRPPVVMSSD